MSVFPLPPLDDNLLNWTKETLTALGYRPSKTLGQNFLISSKTIKRQIQLANISPSDTVLEIGGGLGVLTYALAQTQAKVIVIELSSHLAQFLQNLFQEYSNVQIINADALKTPFPRATKVVSNLPYAISTPITEKILLTQIPESVLMYQFEVAQRLVAPPGSKHYSRLSILAQAFSNVQYGFKVSKTKFYPPPKVDSAIVKFQAKPLPPNYHEFLWLTRELFQRKNKSLTAMLKHIHDKHNIPPISLHPFPETLQQYQNTRIKDLTPHDIQVIIQFYHENNLSLPKITRSYESQNQE